MRATATIVFMGTLQLDTFVAFAEHRARRLALDLRVDDAVAEAVVITVAGQPDLIDAFEMACSLGPLDCLVRDVRRIESTLV